MKYLGASRIRRITAAAAFTLGKRVKEKERPSKILRKLGEYSRKRKDVHVQTRSVSK